ncbi:MAG: zinc-ribbon domain-containing protein [Ruegeria sp.]
MRLTCPKCRAQYEVPEEVIPPGGRDVQCSNCDSTWFQEHPSKPAAEPVAETQPEAAEPKVEAPAVEEEAPAEAAPSVADPVDEVHSEPEAEPVEVAEEDAPVEEVVEEQAEPDEAEPVEDAQPEPQAEEAEAEQDAPVEEIAEEPVEEIAEEPVEAAEEAQPEPQAEPAETEEAEQPAEAAEDMHFPFVEAGDTGDEPEEEVEDEPVAASAGRERALDPAVAAILQQEAAHEAELRAREAETLESQPDLGLETHGSADSGPAAAAGQVDEPAAADSRKDVLPDIDEINSTLRGNVEAAATEQDMAGVAPRKSASFLRGFALMVLIGLALFMLYANAPQITQAVPQADPMINAYVALVDQARVWLDAKAAAILPPR